MTTKQPNTGPDLDDELPDLATPEWEAKFSKATVQRGRPKAAITKVSTMVRLDRDVLQAFKAGGPRWQSRINAALRRAAGL